MRIAISNIAWDVQEDEAVAQLLHQYHIDAIDIAPGKYFPNVLKVKSEDISKVKEWWRQKDIEITGMQALLFGTQGLNLFGQIESRAAMLKQLTAISQIAAELGASRLVFGSPKNRDRSNLSDIQAEDIALNFFDQLGAIAKTYGVIFCLEPNPTCYGCNFMTNMTETATIVRKVASSHIKLQLDTGAMLINQENPQQFIQKYTDFIGHIHLSEPGLIPLGSGEIKHDGLAAALLKFKPQPLACIEMLATVNQPHLDSIKQGIKTAIHFYR